jgi:NADPH2:quinone reductase
LNYKDPNWIHKVKEITKYRECDVVFDPVGMIERSLKVISWGGRMLVVGFAAGSIEKVPMNLVLLKGCSLV